MLKKIASNCSTIALQRCVSFLLYNRINQLCVNIHPLPLEHPSHFPHPTSPGPDSLVQGFRTLVTHPPCTGAFTIKAAFSFTKHTHRIRIQNPPKLKE